MPEFRYVNVTDIVPNAASDLWSEMVPHHGIVIISGLRPNGGEAIHVIHNTDAPVWTLIGMLEAVKADLVWMFQQVEYRRNRDDEDDYDEEEE